MTKLSHIQLNEIDDTGKTFNYESLKALGVEGAANDIDLKSFECQVKVHYAGDGYYINGQIDLVRAFPCSICAQPSEYKQSLKLEDFLRVDPKFDIESLDIAKSDESNSLVVRSSDWNVWAYLRESILLEEPIQFYTHIGATEGQCPEYQKLVERGVLDAQGKKEGPNPFEALKNLRF